MNTSKTLVEEQLGEISTAIVKLIEVIGNNWYSAKELREIFNNPTITQPKIVLQLRYSKSKVNRAIAKLRKLGILTSGESNKTGRWIIMKKL